MNITSNVDGASATLVVEGKLTVQTAPELETAVGNLGQGVNNITIDLTDVDYVSSAGLRVFVATDKLTASRGGEFTLLHPVDDVYEVFEMTGLSDILNIER